MLVLGFGKVVLQVANLAEDGFELAVLNQGEN